MESSRRTQPLTLLLALLLLCIGGVLFYASVTFPDQFTEYRRYLTQKRPVLDLRFEDLSEHLTEAELRERYPHLRFDCVKEAPARGLGDRGCYADLSSFNRVPAMGIAFYFQGDRLERASVIVPSWQHRKMAKSLLAIYGDLSGIQFGRSPDVRLVGWQLANGSALFYNRDRVSNPMDWNMLFWMSRRACLRDGCFLAPDA